MDFSFGSLSSSISLSHLCWEEPRRKEETWLREARRHISIMKRPDLPELNGGKTVKPRPGIAKPLPTCQWWNSECVVCCYQWNFKPTCQQFGVLGVDHVGEVTSVVQDHVEGLTILEVQSLFNAPHVLLIGLTFPRIHYTNRDIFTYLASHWEPCKSVRTHWQWI